MTDEKTIGEELVEGLGKFASCQHELWSCCVCGCTTSTSGVVKLAGEDLAALRRDAARWQVVKRRCEPYGHTGWMFAIQCVSRDESFMTAIDRELEKDNEPRNS